MVRNDIVTRDSDASSAAGWRLEFGDKEGWKVDLDLAYSKVKRKDFVLETYSGYASNQTGTPDTMTYTLAAR